MTEAIGIFRPVGQPLAQGTAAQERAAPAGEARLRALGADFEAALGEEQGTSLNSDTPSAESETAAQIVRSFAIGALFREAFNREWGKEDDNGA